MIFIDLGMGFVKFIDFCILRQSAAEMKLLNMTFI